MAGFDHWATAATHGAIEPDNTTTFVDDRGVLHAGSGGAAATVGILSDTQTKALSLWNGSGNNAVPTLWQAISFDDSAWASAVIVPTGANIVLGTDPFWTAVHGEGLNAISLFRRTFTLPAGPLVSAPTLHFIGAVRVAVYLNGNIISDPGSLDQTFTLPTVLFLPGQANVLAFEVQMTVYPHDAYVSYDLSLSQAGAVGSSAGAALLLDYTETADVLSAATFSSDFWHDVGANHTFAKVHAASLIEIVLSCRLLAQAVGAGLVVVSQFVIDSGGTPVLKDLGGDSVSNAEATMPVDGGSVYLAGLASGTHTVKLQLYPWTGAGIVVNLLCASDPVLYAFHLQVIEHG